MIYTKPVLNSYTACGITEEIGAGQMQYDTTTTTLYPTATSDNSANRGDLDGFIPEDGEYVSTDGGSADLDDDAGIVAGGSDDDPADMLRGFIGFDISSINSTVTSATLTIYQTTTYGEPYSAYGDLMVDHVNWGDSLTASAYSMSGTEIGTISTSSDAGEKTLDVTQYVQDDLDNNRSASQFRIRFSSDSTYSETALVFINDTEQTLGAQYAKPKLEITYY